MIKNNSGSKIEKCYVKSVTYLYSMAALSILAILCTECCELQKIRMAGQLNRSQAPTVVTQRPIKFTEKSTDLHQRATSESKEQIPTCSSSNSFQILLHWPERHSAFHPFWPYSYFFWEGFKISVDLHAPATRKSDNPLLGERYLID